MIDHSPGSEEALNVVFVNRKKFHNSCHRVLSLRETRGFGNVCAIVIIIIIIIIIINVI